MMKNRIKLTDERASFKPFKYEWAYDYWLKSEQMHWMHTEISLIEDLKEWNNKLDEKEKYLLTNIFRFFTQADVDVAGSYVKNYLPHFPQPEVRMMLLSFAGRETIHIASYAHLIESLGMPDTTYNEFMQYKEMADKHEYLLEFQGKDEKSIAQHMAVFSAFTEGLQLFSSFVMLLNFPRHGKLRGMGSIIDMSINDESLHVEGMTKLFRTFVEENRHIWNDELKGQLYTIAAKMVELEDAFVDLAFKMGPLEDLTADDVKQYIRYICDRRLIGMGLKGIYKVKKNPLPWVEEMINTKVHGNFFETRVTDYAKGALTGTWEDVWA